MERVRMRYVPQWEGPIEGMVANMARKHLWRMPPDVEKDDLVQDGFVLFTKCAAKYGATVTEARHFMALMSKAMYRRITDLANDRTDRHEVSAEAVSNPGEMDRPATCRHLEDLEVRLMMEDAPEVVRRLSVALHATEQQSFARVGGVRETHSDYYARVAGAPSGRRLMRQINKFVAGA